MRNEKTCHGARGYLKASASILIVATLSACSGDAIRFTDAFYTNSIPTRPSADVGNPSPVSTPAQQQAAIAASYPGASSQLPPPVMPSYTPPPAQGVDTFTTSSVAPSQPRYQGIGTQPTVTSSSLPTPPATVPNTPAPVQTASVNPVQMVDTSRARQPVQVNAPQGVDNSPTGSVQQPTGALERAEGWTRTGGTYVTVRSGETIYNMAKRYGVPANAIMEANNISDPAAIGVGQRILIPTYVYSRTAPNSTPDADPNVRAASATRGGRSEFGIDKAPYPKARPGGYVASNTAPAPVAAPVPQVRETAAAPAPSGRYVVQSGDSLYGISRKTGASVDGIKRVNGMTSDVVRIGQSLIIPGVNTSTGTTVASNAAVDPITTSSVPSQRPNNTTSSSTGGTQLASIDRNDTTVAPSSTGVAKMRWPAQGRVITGFKANDGGVPNEGIDISVPVGTPVKAAENGVVIYAGDGLKELGKTVLVRHDDGLVTVYGHADSIKVNRGEKVARGQTIASSGMTGNARKPKLHFEIRKNTTAVDPLTYLN